jgi:replicative superfamily II helicase
MILDEIHLLGADRGPILEVILTNCCNFFLSAAAIMESKFSEFLS